VRNLVMESNSRPSIGPGVQLRDQGERASSTCSQTVHPLCHPWGQVLVKRGCFSSKPPPFLDLAAVGKIYGAVPSKSLANLKM